MKENFKVFDTVDISIETDSRIVSTPGDSSTGKGLLIKYLKNKFPEKISVVNYTNYETVSELVKKYKDDKSHVILLDNIEYYIDNIADEIMSSSAEFILFGRYVPDNISCVNGIADIVSESSSLKLVEVIKHENSFRGQQIIPI